MTDQPAKCPRILIVEDDADQRQLLCEALGYYYRDPAGNNIVAVSSGADCLRQDLAQFDVVLQDYNLPDMPGLALIREILARTDLPVILVTGENVSATAAEAIRCGAQDYVVKLGDYLFSLPCMVDKNIRQHHVKIENQRLLREREAMLERLQTVNAQLQESLEKLRTMATTDHLTGLANRRSFSEALDRCFGEALRYGFDLACCMFDLDHYKQLNDSLGHQVGDEILILAADVIRSSLRSTDLAARYGGDEFVLLLPHTSVERGLAVGERIRQELVCRSRRHPRLRRPITLSMGIASLAVDNPASSDELVAMADRALYVAKEQGKDRVVVHGQACSPARQQA